MDNLKSSAEIALDKTAAAAPAQPAQSVPANPPDGLPGSRVATDRQMDGTRMAAVIAGNSTAAPNPPVSRIPSFPTPRPPNAPRLSDEVIARKYLNLITTADQLRELAAASKAVAREQKLIEDHSQPICQARSKEALVRYAEDPNSENLKKMREAKSIDLHEHSLIQFHAAKRKEAILSEQVSPLMQEIYNAAAVILEERALAILAADLELWQEFGLAPQTHPVAANLQAMAHLFRNSAKGRGGQEMDDLARAILKMAAEQK